MAGLMQQVQERQQLPIRHQAHQQESESCLADDHDGDDRESRGLVLRPRRLSLRLRDERMGDAGTRGALLRRHGGA